MSASGHMLRQNGIPYAPIAASLRSGRWHYRSSFIFLVYYLQTGFNSKASGKQVIITRYNNKLSIQHNACEYLVEAESA